MERSNSYRDLIAWQEAMKLVYAVYRLSTGLPVEERFGLSSQIRRSAVSVASNIAEGQGRNSRGEFVQFLGNARGSLHEVETQLLIIEHLEYVGEEQVAGVVAQCDKVSRLLNGLMNSLRAPASSAEKRDTGK